MGLLRALRTGHCFTAPSPLPPPLDTALQPAYRNHVTTENAHPQLDSAHDGVMVQTLEATRVLILNRPERRNALIPDMAQVLAAQIEAAGRDDTVRVVLIQGAGGHFCVGLDLKWFAELGTPEAVLAEGLEVFQGVVRAIVRCPLPVVAVLEGSVAGIGLDIALACDLRIASDTVSCTSAFAALGLVPDGGSTFTLPRVVGLGNALNIFMAGEAVDADRALNIGLVTAVYGARDIEAEKLAVAQRIARNARTSLSHIKALARGSEREALDRHLELEGKAQVQALRSEEFRERMQTFLRGSKTP